MTRRTWVYTNGGQYLDGRTGLRLVTDPKCITWEGEGKTCGKPATKRVWRLPYWSFPWCDQCTSWFDR